MISHEQGKDREVFTTSGTHPWSFVTQIFHNGQPSRGGDRKTFVILLRTDYHMMSINCILWLVIKSKETNYIVSSLNIKEINYLCQRLDTFT